MRDHDMLRAAYRANGSFSIVSATIFIVLGAWLAPIVGLPGAAPLVVVGAGLVPFGAWLFWLATGPGLTPQMGRAVSIMDAGWVVGTGVLLLGWPELLSPTGRGLALAIAAVVAGFAAWQIAGSRRIAPIAG